MNKKEHYLTILAEECSEVAICANRLAQRVTKALRFGVDEIQPGQLLSNAERIAQELNDLIGSVEMLIDDGILDWQVNRDAVEAKKEKIKYFLERSKEYDTLDGD
jgi:hypothetical protein